MIRPSDLGSLILIQIIPKERSLRVEQLSRGTEEGLFQSKYTFVILQFGKGTLQHKVF